ncbi:hypothetical protein JCM11641_006337 [Rhodosporidiobolus odoratus]
MAYTLELLWRRLTSSSSPSSTQPASRVPSTSSQPVGQVEQAHYGSNSMVLPQSDEQDTDDNERRKPRVLLMGPRSGGKSSIRKVVFEGMAPSDTLFIEKTAKSSSDDINSFLSMRMWDLPGGQLDPEQLNLSFEDTDAVIFVLDAQSTLHDMIRKLSMTMYKAYTANPGIQFEIFLHKVDGMSEDFRLDTLQNLRDRLTEELFDMSPELESNMNVFYHLTSVFDTSIYEALSKVIQKLIPEQAMLERLLDLLCQQCSMDKAFLFETSSKIYIATDSSPLDNQTYVICADYLDLVGDFTQLYESVVPCAIVTIRKTVLTFDYCSPSPSSLPPATDLSRSGTLPPSRSMRIDTSSNSAASSAAPLSPQPRRDSSSARARPGPVADMRDPRGKGRMPCSKVTLGTGATIAQWSINDNLSLVTLLRPHAQDQHSALIEYNVAEFRRAVLAVFEVGVSPPL